ncbi:MAG: phosphatase PAP2 family protein [Anaerolineales bacterium]
MLESLETGWGLDVVLWLQERRTGLLDALAGATDFAGDTLFFLAILPIFLWCIDKNLGRRMLFTLMVTGVVSYFLKALFDRPRPFEVAPEQVERLVSASQGGIPSGHTMVSLAVWGVLAIWVAQRYPARRGLAWGLLAAYVVLMGLSRMYNGVHYPQDVVAGIFFAGIILAGVLPFEAWAAPRWFGLPPMARVGLGVMVWVISVALIWDNSDALALLATLAGGVVAMVLDRTRIGFSPAGPPAQRAARYIAGLILLVGAFLLMDSAFEPLEPAPIWRALRYGITGFLALAGIPWLFVRLGLAPRDLTPRPGQPGYG